MSVSVDRLITPEILKPARYLGNELGAVHKPWDEEGASVMVRWCLTYPEIYEVGASNLGHIILYSILNAQVGQLCDRSYLPAPDLAAKLRDTRSPLFAVESKRPLTDFDILGFSLSYELGATNILEMLDLAGIPLTWQERLAAVPHYPLIFAGGQTATSNPEPYADFFDFFALGDGEEVLPEIGKVMQLAKEAGKSRWETLLDLAQVKGVYVPQFYDLDICNGSVKRNREDVPQRILRRVATPMPEHSIGLVPLIETVHDRLTIEIRRGCTRGCRFCQPGMLTRPARDVNPEDVVNTIARAVRETGYNEFSLLSLSCSDYLALPAVGVEIKNRLKDERVSLSLPSQRVDRFDANIANILKNDGEDTGRQQGLTFAPEAGTQRLRDVINKGLTDEELLRGVKTAYEQGWDRVKLYFMIGLPTETDADVFGIAQTIGWLQSQCRLPDRKRLSVNVTIANFTPKPHTPFQWHSVSDAEFQRKHALLRREFRHMKGVKVNFTDIRISAMEDFIGRGDRRLGAAIKRAWELGAGMDAWFENSGRAFAAWTEAIADAGLQWHMPTPDIDQPLPWDHIDTGIDKQWLKDDWQRAIAEKTVPDCSFHGCSQCGVCGSDFGHNIVVPPLPIPEFLGTKIIATPSQQRLRVTFGKLGSMALISHLDVMRLFERATRRANLPIAFTGGFNPMPRVAIASALSLGHTSTGEIADFELTTVIDPEEFQQRFAAQLPPEMPIYNVQEVPLDSIAAAIAIQRAEYTLQLAVEEGSQRSAVSGQLLEGGQRSAVSGQLEEEKAESRKLIADSSLKADSFLLELQTAIAKIKAATSILMPKTTKSGREVMVELRDRLFSLELIEPSDTVRLRRSASAQSSRAHAEAQSPTIHYTGTCLTDGNVLKPDHVVFMLRQFSNLEITLVHTHRDRLHLT